MSTTNRRTLPEGIYGITAERFSRGRSNVDVAREMIAGGVKILQYREKHGAKSFRDMLTQCRAIRKLTREHGVVFMVNDDVDLALAAEADGVHIGQDDLPPEWVRSRVGERIVGLSTHSPEQARAAEKAGVDYIGVGPIFATGTKADVCDPVGLEYLQYCTAHISLPQVAIGGIKAQNIAQVAACGARTVCLVTEIVSADDISGMVRALAQALGSEV
ncbi:MAG: thiamine phosphate synthase [Desulfobacterales bacterium]|nr:thiamine phosphate synthase [Desulfobacterales bacterium]